ncbi:hypothetical protein B0A52_04266 [Exophiala mesophila]|uniref:Uncharacterized protein n=1 Tax=Exophiala mesophila TaxID=212818 RepID=A0A438N878_EXOME|nr:hypothetical protein B0A52_04266 [Exophiala mesophila]
MSELSPPGKYSSKLFGKRILVLGGTSGIGFCVAEAAREAGATVIISGSGQSKLDSAIQRIEKSYFQSSNGGSIRGYAQDLSDPNTIETALISIFNLATDNGVHKLHHVVYTAGNVVGLVAMEDLTPEVITANGIMRFHVPILIGKIAPQFLEKSYESSITFTSGYSHIRPRAGRVLMGGWAAGVEGVTRVLAVDLKPIRVNCVCPGAVHTELFDRLPKEKLDPLVDSYVSKTLTGNIGRPEQVVESYMFCIKDCFVDGSIVHTNGGYLLG